MDDEGGKCCKRLCQHRDEFLHVPAADRRSCIESLHLPVIGRLEPESFAFRPGEECGHVVLQFRLRCRVDDDIDSEVEQALVVVSHDIEKVFQFLLLPADFVGNVRRPGTLTVPGLLLFLYDVPCLKIEVVHPLPRGVIRNRCDVQRHDRWIIA